MPPRTGYAMNVYDDIINDNSKTITINQGSDASGVVTVMTPSIADPTVMVAMDLTGYTVRGQLRTLTGHLAGTITCTIPAPLTGQIPFSIPKAVTAKLLPGTEINHVSGFELTAGDGTVIPEIQCAVLVTPQVVI